MAVLKMYSVGHLQQVSSFDPCIFALPQKKVLLVIVLNWVGFDINFGG